MDEVKGLRTLMSLSSLDGSIVSSHGCRAPPFLLISWFSVWTPPQWRGYQDQDTSSLHHHDPGFVSALRCHNQQDNWAQPSHTLHTLSICPILCAVLIQPVSARVGGAGRDEIPLSVYIKWLFFSFLHIRLQRWQTSLFRSEQQPAAGVAN